MYLSQTDLAHHLWKLFLKKNTTLIDATCGNGKDSLFLAQHNLENAEGTLYCIDTQAIAIENTRKHLKENLSENTFKKIIFQQSCHSEISHFFPAAAVIFNLGYLPGTDHQITTQTRSTLLAIEQAMEGITKEGFISVMVYPGHAEGAKEARAVEDFFSKVNKKEFYLWSHEKLTAAPSPKLFIVQKKRP